MDTKYLEARSIALSKLSQSILDLPRIGLIGKQYVSFASILEHLNKYYDEHMAVNNREFLDHDKQNDN